MSIVSSSREHHPVSNIFPIMSDEDAEHLQRDIEQNGLLEPVWIHHECGRIIDGRHRLHACENLGIEIRTRTWRGEESDLVPFVVSLNMRRRHMTTGQKAVAALAAEKLEAERARERSFANLKKGSAPDGPNSAHRSNEGRSAEKAAALFGIGKTAVKTAKAIERDAPDLLEEVRSGDLSLHAASKKAKQRPLPMQAEDDNSSSTSKMISLKDWEGMSQSEQEAALLTQCVDAKFNSQKSDNIEWARWSWNPITGCLHNCVYCYDRDIAARFYPQKFAPTLLPYRLSAPQNMTPPKKARTEIGFKNVFVCSMADLFGRWVPAQWIEAVLHQVASAPEWNFLFLTKFPKRLVEFSFPENAWLGASVDSQKRVSAAEQAFSEVDCRVKWLSCEPLLEPLQFSNLAMFDWVVIGGASKSTQSEEFFPPREWIADLEDRAREDGCMIYEKTNLFQRIKEYPR